MLGRSFFPTLIGSSIRSELHAPLDFAIVASLLVAAASWVRGAKGDEVETTDEEFNVTVD